VKQLILDIETAPLISYHWGLWDQNISINQIKEPGYVLCWAAKWHGKPKVHFKSIKHHGKEKMLKGVFDLLEQADSVIHYNGTRFDIPTLNGEFVTMKWPRPAPFAQIDLLQVARKQFRLPSNKLAYVAQHLGVGNKTPGTNFDLWKDCMNGKPKAWALMKKYNIQDVSLTESVYDRLLPWITTHPNHGLHVGSPACTNCGSTHLQRRGTARTKTMEYQRFQCRDCGSWVRDRRAEKRDRKHIMAGVA